MSEQEGTHGHDGPQPYLPPVPPPTPRSSQLPADISRFVGRDAELARLHELATQEQGTLNRARVILISGMAGVGKSSLAIRLAHELKSSYPKAQLYANYRFGRVSSASPYSQTDEQRVADVLESFLRALGVQGEAMPAALYEKESLYRSLLAGQRALILVDGAQTAMHVTPLIPAAPGSLVLVTSRSRLQQLGAAWLRLDVFDVPSAVRLLGELAGQEKIENERSEAERVVELCGRLPLAIAIAGARLESRANWSVRSLAERLGNQDSDVIDELVEGERGVAASFSLSYEALAADEQKLFRRLSVFGGPHFDDSAAASLMDSPASSVARMLDRLADLQLLEPGPWPDCYRFHDLLRRFARKLFEVDEPPEVQRECYAAILDYYDRRLKEADRTLQPTIAKSPRDVGTGDGNDNRAASLRWLGQERENLIFIVKQAVDAGELDRAWQLAARLASFFEVRAHYEDWLATHRSVLDRLDESEYALGRAVLTRSLGKLLYFQHKWDEAVENYRNSLQLFHRLGDDREVGVTLLYLGDTYRYKREWDSARNTLTAGLDLLEQTGFRRGEAIALRSLGAVSRLTGDFAVAKEAYGRALDILEEIGDNRWIAATQLSLSDIYLDEENPADARPILEQCLRTFREYGDRHWEALTLRSMGDALREEKKFAEALERLEASLEILRADGDAHWEAATIEAIGEVYAAQGKWQEAVTHYENCIRMLTEETQDRLLEAHARKNFGIALAALGDRQRAEAQWRDAWLSFVEQNGQEAIEVHKLLRDRPA